MTPSDIKYLAVHCSASKPDVYVDASVINRWHVDRGFAKIGYHYVIKRDGTVEKGRADTEIGAHVQGYNRMSLGICLAGGLDANGNPLANYTNEQYAALEILLKKLLVTHPHAVVQGHRDFPNVAKACPCFDVKPWWSAITKGVQSLSKDDIEHLNKIISK